MTANVRNWLVACTVMAGVGLFSAHAWAGR